MKKSGVRAIFRCLTAASTYGLLLLFFSSYNDGAAHAASLRQVKGTSSLSGGGTPAPPTPKKKDPPPKKDKPTPPPKTKEKPAPPITKASPPRAKEKSAPPIVKTPAPNKATDKGKAAPGRTTVNIEAPQTTAEATRLTEEANTLFNQETRESYLQAGEKFGQAFAIYYRISNKRSQAVMAFNAGTAYLNANENASAIEWLDKAIPLYHELANEQANEADAWKALAQAHCRLDDQEKCGAAYQNAAVLYLSRNLTAKALESFRTAAKTRLAMRNFAEARLLFTQALEVTKSTSDSKNEIDLLSWVARTFESEANYASALETYQTALALARPDSPALAVELLNNIGVNHLRLGDYDKAMTAHQEALDLAQAQNNKTGINVSQSYLEQVRRAKEKAAAVTPPS